ncbi:hypothetical protein GETHLI_00840 [Geothrix limicola]|uniref:Cytochrome c domain-containing protein n=1 Tax=Geothrix limicola TaxID=2927978 RepID=A0ABQ5QAD9_9BACT|nr:hypothetical protein [Geothrix limicola]GLH71582.1 hypothetical protein GETHLI_00840 [Geothrix limicola]
MPLRTLPRSERIFASLAVLALALALGLGLAAALKRELSLTPKAAPPARSRLVAVLEGVMATNTTEAERERFRAWVASGATREGYAQVEPIVTNTCAACHDRGGQYPHLTGFEDLRPIALESVPEGLMGFLGARGLHLAVFPGLFLLALGGYLRRTEGVFRKRLLVASLILLAFDMAQWALRQGRPEHLWAAWAGAAGLALAMAAVVGVVLFQMWAGNSEA